MIDKNIKIKFKGVIFDLDGTLADTLEDISDSMNGVLLRNGFPVHDYKTYQIFAGKGLENLVTNSLPEGFKEKEIIARCVELMINDYRNNCLSKTKLYPGIAEMLDKLKEYDIKLGVLSNKAEELTQKIVKALLYKWNFNAIIGASHELPMKPDPAGALMITEIFGIPPSKIIYLGDSGIDMITANKAGMFAIGVTWGFRDRKELMENSAKILIDHPIELINLLADSR